MKIPHKTYFSWSSGKDAAMALYALMQDSNYDVQQLITTVNGHYQRVSMHGLRNEMLDRQLASLGLPLRKISLPEQPNMEEYDAIMGKELESFVKEGVSHIAYGDIFLEDLKAYRDLELAKHNLQGVYPLWKQDSRTLIQEFIKLGFKAVIVCIKGEFLGESFLGREIDQSFLEDLPEHVDPCGENGEFHTFCYDGPIFSHPIRFRKGERVMRAYKAPSNSEDENSSSMRFWFQDLIPI
ncbi:MAG: ATP-binding protein [Bacteroidota bacterium]